MGMCQNPGCMLHGSAWWRVCFTPNVVQYCSFCTVLVPYQQESSPKCTNVIFSTFSKNQESHWCTLQSECSPDFPCLFLVGGWYATPFQKIWEFVSWDSQLDGNKQFKCCKPPTNFTLWHPTPTAQICPDARIRGKTRRARRLKSSKIISKLTECWVLESDDFQLGSYCIFQISSVSSRYHQYLL